MRPYEPQVHPVEISALRPTQIAVGYREVERKRASWRKRADTDGADFLGRHMVPVVIGPKDVPYLIDHHHLVRALYEEGVKHILTATVVDASHLGKQEFWAFLDHRNWVYPYDIEGRRQDFAAVPKRVSDLADDHYRSLAGALRDAGGFAKEAIPFTEFQWADFLRNRIGAKLVERDFDTALAEAVALAHSKKARHLPGWCGPQHNASVD